MHQNNTIPMTPHDSRSNSSADGDVTCVYTSVSFIQHKVQCNLLLLHDIIYNIKKSDCWIYVSFYLNMVTFNNKLGG